MSSNPPESSTGRALRGPSHWFAVPVERTAEVSGRVPRRDARCDLVVVDDSELILELAAVALRERGAGIRTARSKSEASAIIEEEPPDLVLTDLQMPGGSGIELLDWLRSRYPGIPGLLMTSSRDYEKPPWVRRVVEKPFCFDELWRTIVDTLDGH